MENDKDLLLVAVFTFLTVSLWITFELVKTVKTTTVTSPVQRVVTPLSASIDIDLLTKLKERPVY